jgi:hypothetical protein
MTPQVHVWPSNHGRSTELLSLHVLLFYDCTYRMRMDELLKNCDVGMDLDAWWNELAVECVLSFLLKEHCPIVFFLAYQPSRHNACFRLWPKISSLAPEPLGTGGTSTPCKLMAQHFGIVALTALGCRVRWTRWPRKNTTTFYPWRWRWRAGWEGKGACGKNSQRGSSYDEVLTRQCPCLGLSIHGAYVGAWRIRQLQTETGGAHEFTQVRPPEG